MFELIAPIYYAYAAPEQQLLERLIRLAKADQEVQRATVASALQIIDTARNSPIQFSLRQVFQEFPLTTPEGETLFQLLAHLPSIDDKEAQQLFIQSCFESAHWLDNPKHRAVFFQRTASWGLSIAARLFSATSHLTGKKRAQRLASPLTNGAIAQAMNRLIGPLMLPIEAFENLDIKTTPRHFRIGCYAPLSPKDSLCNQTIYLQWLDKIALRYEPLSQTPDFIGMPHVCLDLGHLARPFDPRDEHKVAQLLTLILPIVELAQSYAIPIIVFAPEYYGHFIETGILIQLIEDHKINPQALGIEYSAADPGCLASIEMLTNRLPSNQPLIIRLTKEKRQPSISHAQNTHIAYLGIARFLMAAPHLFTPVFVTHNAYTLAWLYHSFDNLKIKQFEFQFRLGVGDSCHTALQHHLNAPMSRVETPLGTAAMHQDYLIYRVGEIADKHAFLNRLINKDITTASLVTPPTNQPPLTSWQQQDWHLQWLANEEMLATIQVDNEEILQSLEQNLTIEEAEYLLAEYQPQNQWSLLTDTARRTLLLECFDLRNQQVQEFACGLIQILMNAHHSNRYVAEALVRSSFQQTRQHLKDCEIDRSELLKIPHQWFVIACSLNPLTPFLGHIAQALFEGHTLAVKPPNQYKRLHWQIQNHLQVMGLPSDAYLLLPMANTTADKLLKSSPAIQTVLFHGEQVTSLGIQTCIRQNPRQPLINYLAHYRANTLRPCHVVFVDVTTTHTLLASLTSEPPGQLPRIICCPVELTHLIHQALLDWQAASTAAVNEPSSSQAISIVAAEDDLETKLRKLAQSQNEASCFCIQQLNQQPIILIDYAPGAHIQTLKKLVELGCCHHMTLLSQLPNWKTLAGRIISANQFSLVWDEPLTEPLLPNSYFSHRV